MGRDFLELFLWCFMTNVVVIFVAGEEKKKRPSESGSERSSSSGTATHVFKRLNAAEQRAAGAENRYLPLVNI